MFRQRNRRRRRRVEYLCTRGQTADQIQYRNPQRLRHKKRPTTKVAPGIKQPGVEEIALRPDFSVNSPNFSTRLLSANSQTGADITVSWIRSFSYFIIYYHGQKRRLFSRLKINFLTPPFCVATRIHPLGPARQQSEKFFMAERLASAVNSVLQ